jgi:hypothetical protein
MCDKGVRFIQTSKLGTLGKIKTEGLGVHPDCNPVTRKDPDSFRPAIQEQLIT